MLKIILLFVIIIATIFLYRKLSIYTKKKQKTQIKLYTYLLMVFLIIVILILLNLDNNNTNKIYNPPSFNGEKIIPGFFSDE